MAQLNPYLSFNGTCREAMSFYADCLGGKVVDLMTFAGSPMTESMPAELHDRILHSMLVADGIVLMAADTPTDQAVNQGDAMTLCLNSPDKDEIRGYYEKLAEGANISQPLMETFFGLYGALTDKFGINWMFQAGAPDA